MQNSEPVPVRDMLVSGLHRILPSHVCDREANGLNTRLILPVTQEEDTSRMIRRCRVTEGSGGIGKPEKVILLLGPTGAGKTVLLNCMANYIMGVDLDESQRVYLLPIESDTNSSVSRSQTRWISAYTFEHQPGFRVPYTVTIIDTPGVGDTDGIEQDYFFFEQLKHLLTTDPPLGLDHIDAVCYVVKVSENRLNHEMKYCLQKILEMFHKDTERIFYIFSTFYDGNRPCVLEALSEANVQFQQHFSINNLSFFASTSNMSQQAMMKEGFMRLEMFFLEVGNSLHQHKCSLTHTREVLSEREKLQWILVSLKEKIQILLADIDESQQITVEVNKFKMENGKEDNFKMAVIRSKFVLKPTGGPNVTNCLKCRNTCCDGCYIRYKKFKWFCEAIDMSGNCRKCQHHCKWKMHCNPHYRYEPCEETVFVTNEELKRKFEVDLSQKQQLLATIQRKINTLRNNMVEALNTARLTLQRLNEICLRPGWGNTMDYLDMLIEEEKAEMSCGWDTRLEQLYLLKDELKSDEVILAQAQQIGEIDANTAVDNIVGSPTIWNRTKRLLQIATNSCSAEKYSN